MYRIYRWKAKKKISLSEYQRTADDCFFFFTRFTSLACETRKEFEIAPYIYIRGNPFFSNRHRRRWPSLVVVMTTAIIVRHVFATLFIIPHYCNQTWKLETRVKRRGLTTSVVKAFTSKKQIIRTSFVPCRMILLHARDETTRHSRENCRIKKPSIALPIAEHAFDLYAGFGLYAFFLTRRRVRR